VTTGAGSALAGGAIAPGAAGDPTARARCSGYDRWVSVTSSARRSAAPVGDVPWLRVGGLLVLAWWTVRLATGVADWCFMDFVNLAFHEAGHVFATPFGRTVHYLGGTLGQLAVPVILVGYFLVRRHQPAGAAFAFWWLGESLVNVATYMADARTLALPLVGGGDHDWNELFYRFGVLDESSVAAISGATRGAGVAVMVLGLLWWAALSAPERFRDRIRRGLPDHRLQGLLD